ncbi:hypothetical protein [Corynebacterium sp. Marseille-P4321]|uniref:hypothetical protein n=1 Tax=Corynebacterium sp. Marseille-P4321 TaxID=2736603 RepID=UPI00158925FB|nr:hypothetical protein [Corynebacterium sp. Marseille-P4321]
MFSRKLAASAAALTLATGLVACSDDADTTTDTEVVEETATETNTATETAAEETVTESTSADAADNADATEELALADGTTAMVPAGLIAAMDDQVDPAWGEPLSVEEIDNGWVVTYDNENYFAWNENTNGAPLVGQIANEWITDTQSENVLGFPLAPEEQKEDESGWIQEFENGTIEWTRGGTEDAFTAIITPNN